MLAGTSSRAMRSLNASSRASSTRYETALGSGTQVAVICPWPAGAKAMASVPPAAHAGAGGSGRGGIGAAVPTKREPKLVGTSIVLPPETTPALPSNTATVVRAPLRSTTVSREAALTRPPPLIATSTGSPRSAERPAFTSPDSTSTAAGGVFDTWV